MEPSYVRTPRAIALQLANCACSRRRSRRDSDYLRCTQLLTILARVELSRHSSGGPDLLHDLISRRVSHDNIDAYNEVPRGDHEVCRHLADFFVLADCQRDEGGAPFLVSRHPEGLA